MKSFKYFSCSQINFFVYWRNSRWKPKDIIKTKQKLRFCDVKILDRHRRDCTWNNSQSLTIKGHFVWHWKCTFLKALILNFFFLINTWRVSLTYLLPSIPFIKSPKHSYLVILDIFCKRKEKKTSSLESVCKFGVQTKTCASNREGIWWLREDRG